MKPNPELLQIALGFISAGMNGGFLQDYILRREVAEGRVLPSMEFTTEKAIEVVGHLDDLARTARREQ